MDFSSLLYYSLRHFQFYKSPFFWFFKFIVFFIKTFPIIYKSPLFRFFIDPNMIPCSTLTPKLGVNFTVLWVPFFDYHTYSVHMKMCLHFLALLPSFGSLFEPIPLKNIQLSFISMRIFLIAHPRSWSHTQFKVIIINFGAFFDTHSKLVCICQYAHDISC